MDIRERTDTGEGQKGDAYKERTLYGGKDIRDGQQRKGGGMKIRGGGGGGVKVVK
jgi:hypothetical protein